MVMWGRFQQESSLKFEDEALNKNGKDEAIDINTDQAVKK